MDHFEEALVDGDLLVYACVMAAEYGQEIESVNLHEILNTIDSKIMNMKARLGAKRVRLFFSGGRNFRRDVMPEYKANRDHVIPPHYLAEAKLYCMHRWDAEVEEGLEADDLMCINQKYDDSTVICTIDKDMLQARGWHYRWETIHNGEKLQKVEGIGNVSCVIKTDSKGKNSKKIGGTGLKFFCLQLLTGDPVDGITGCATMTEKTRKTGKNAGETYMSRDGVGPVEAYDALESAPTYAEALRRVIVLYKKEFGDLWEHHILRQGRCLYMVKQRDGDSLQLWHWNAERMRTESKFSLESRTFLAG